MLFQYSLEKKKKSLKLHSLIFSHDNSIVLFWHYHCMYSSFFLFYSLKVYLRYECIAFDEKSPGFVYPFLGVVDIYSTWYSHLEIFYSCIDYPKLSVKKVNSIHLLLVNCQTLTNFTRTITKILQLVTLYVSNLAHLIKTHKWLNCSYQHCLRLSLKSCDNIQTNISWHVDSIDVEASSIKPEILCFFSLFI